MSDYPTTTKSQGENFSPSDRPPCADVFARGEVPQVALRFSGEGFAAVDAAYAFCHSNGYAVGSMQADAPMGVLHGDYSIAKWRNLSRVERAELDGTIEGDKRNGPVYLYLRAALLKAGVKL